MSGRYRLVDARTGEDLGPTREPRPRSRTMYSQASRRVHSARSRLARQSLTALDVLEWLALQAGTTGGVRTSQGAIARYVGRPRPSVSKALRLLETLGFLASEPGAGREKLYFVDPEFSWTGYPTSAAMAKAPYYKARKAAGAEGVPEWRRGPDPWRLSRAERMTIAYVPGPDAGAATEDDWCGDDD